VIIGFIEAVVLLPTVHLQTFLHRLDTDPVFQHVNPRAKEVLRSALAEVGEQSMLEGRLEDPEFVFAARTVCRQAAAYAVSAMAPKALEGLGLK
jgi:hypothetical protein